MALGHWLKDYIGPHGGSAKPLIVKKNGDALDHTWQEIVDAPMAWLETTLRTQITRDPLSGIIADEGTEYSVVFDGTRYETNSPNGYPTKGVS